MSLDPVSRQEIDSLKDHLDTRFDNVNRWIEACTDALTRLEPSHERLARLETGQLFMQESMRKYEERMVKMETSDSAHSKQITKVLTIGGLLCFAISIVAPELIRHLLGS